MKPIVLDAVGGGFYLLHKVLSDLTAATAEKKVVWKFRLLASTAYLLGIPPTVAVFLQTERMIFALIELGGAPAMIGAIIAAAQKREPPKWLSLVAIAAIPVGVWLAAENPAARDLPPAIEILAHWLEITGALGFLVGTCLQMFPRWERTAYAWFLIMNIATAVLMAIDGRWLWVPQQIVSMVFILDAICGAPMLRFLFRFVRNYYRKLLQ